MYVCICNPSSVPLIRRLFQQHTIGRSHTTLSSSRPNRKPCGQSAPFFPGQNYGSMNSTPRGVLPRRMPYTQDKGQDAVGTYENLRGASADALRRRTAASPPPCLSGDPLVIFCVCMCGVLSCVPASCFGAFSLAFLQQQPACAAT